MTIGVAELCWNSSRSSPYLPRFEATSAASLIYLGVSLSTRSLLTASTTTWPSARQRLNSIDRFFALLFRPVSLLPDDLRYHNRTQTHL